MKMGNTDALLRVAIGAGDAPGVVAAVTNAKGTMFKAAHGVRELGQPAAMSLDTVLRIASMTKPVVGAAAMQLVERGKIGLDEPAAKLIPELGEFKVMEGWDEKGQPRLRPPKTAITLRNLLTHSAGFTYDMWNPDMARYARERDLPRAGSGKNIALRVPLMFDPDARWEYGINIDWAGKLIEAASGMRLGEYLRENVTGPIGMDSTGFKVTLEMRERIARVHQRNDDGGFTVNPLDIVENPEFEPGGGGLYSTADDYLRFMRMILAKGSANGNQVLRPETVELMSKNSMGDLRVRMLPTQNPKLSLDAEFFPGLPKSWGLTFMINEEAAPTGRSAGSLAWAGLTNAYFWIDLKKEFAGLIMMQILPFVDTRALALFTDFEKSVYAWPAYRT